jgi:asparagine synthase (glutamine-hydrolysing)
MCGILGAFFSYESIDQSRRFDAAMGAIQHRGPDAQVVETYAQKGGDIFLGHSRLSIIDLTDGGKQPMKSADERYTIVFNGEIYNYKELRPELSELGHVFTTDSDTEVLLAAWGAWGISCLRRLVGMFAFAVLDRETSTIACVRDAFGIKPFYYTQENEDFLFASEAPALIKLKASKPKVNWQKSYDYLVHGEYDSGKETFFEGIFQLPPGHFFEFDIQSRTVGKATHWWHPSIVERSDLSFEEAATRVRENFLRGVKLHLRSDVALGAALSGGLDSSAVVCAMKYLEPNSTIHTFSFIAAGAGISEEKWVDVVNDRVGAIPHKVKVTSQELLRDLDTMIMAQGEPFGSMSIYAQYRVYQLAKENGITVTLDGQGADEMLGGYVGFPGERMHSLVESGDSIGAFSFLRKWAKWPGRNFGPGLRAALAEMSSGIAHEWLRSLAGMNRVPNWIDAGRVQEMGLRDRIPRFRSGELGRGRRMVAQMLNLLSSQGLVGLLRHGDRNSMRFSIESRVPFLTLEQVEFMLSLPEKYLVSPEGETKHVFRRAMKGIVPDEVLARKDKIGFEPPEKDWLMSIAPQARSWLAIDMHIPFIRREALLAQFDAVIAGHQPFSWQVWRWINFYRWKACLAD